MTSTATISKINGRDDGTITVIPTDDHAHIEPSAAQRGAALALYQLFVALQQRGFTEQQALTLVGQLLTSSAGLGGDAHDD